MGAETMPIAIIGMSCRFAGDATSPERLWRLCAEARSAWSKVPETRFNQEAFYHPVGTQQGRTNVKGGHFLREDVSLFDASFFNFSSEVASTMDPQFRLQLESVFEALESAGLPVERIAGSQTSVFAGAFFRDYHDSLMRDPEGLPRYFMTGNGAAMAANRISHFYDLRGPSMTIDTGCSTTLTALHLACQSLRSGDSRVSIVGGANVMLNPDMFESMASLGFLSPDGKSYAFDSRASGYGRGEGVATVIIKPLQDAINDGDPIRAVIRETALNQDGKTPTLTSPNQSAQEELLRTIYQKAGLNPAETTYVEAHGTGTQAGDPVEAGALSAVFSKGRSSDKPLLVGSVKMNLGHTEAASGLAAVIKVAMALEKGYIPPGILYNTPNSKIPLELWKLKIPTALEPWPLSQGIRRASVNNFGYGGSNAHVIMESHVTSIQHETNGITNGVTNGVIKVTNGVTNGITSSIRTSITNGVCNRALISRDTPSGHKFASRIFVLSGKDENSTKAMISNLVGYLKEESPKDEDKFLRNLAFTLGQRRSIFQWSAAHFATSVPGLIKALENGNFMPTRSPELPKLGFVFTGQGAQWYAMGRELIDAYPVFRASLVEAEFHLKSFGATWSVIDELMRDPETTKVNQITLSLPICTALQISLVNLLRSWNINPTAVTGHSSGEVGAAYAAGAIGFRSAMAIVYLRGALTTTFQEKVGGGKGAMLAVSLSREEAESRISNLTKGKVVVACVNSPGSITISGDMTAIEELESHLLAEKIFARRLKVDAAYHSHHMLPIAEDYLFSLRQILKQEGNFGKVLYSSPVNGETMKSAVEISSPEHWVKNMLQPVLFTESLSNMCRAVATNSSKTSRVINTILELGPHSALAGPIRQTLALEEFKNLGISYASCLVRGSNAVETMQNLACTLRSRGYDVDMASVNFPQDKSCLQVLPNLPSYPWNHQNRHWMEPRRNKAHRFRKHTIHDLLGSPSLDSNALAPTWRHIIRPSEIPWVHDHKIASDIIYPGAGFICMAIEAANQISQSEGKEITGFQLRDIEILRALIVPDTPQGIETQLSLSPCSDKILWGLGWQEFHVYSVTSSEVWTEHCKGFVLAKTQILENGGPRDTDTSQKLKFHNSSGLYTRKINPDDLYRSLQSLGINHGPVFQNLAAIHCGQEQSLSSFTIADTAALMPANVEHRHIIHPTTLDSAFQAAYSALPGAGLMVENAMIPRSIKSMFISSTISSNAGHHFRAHSRLQRNSSNGFQTTITIASDDDLGSVSVLEIEELACQSVGNAPRRQLNGEEDKLCFNLHWAPDMSLTSTEMIRDPLKFKLDSIESDVILDLRRACFYFAHNALQSLTQVDLDQFETHQQSFYSWMNVQVRLAEEDKLAPQSSTWIHSSEAEQERVFERVKSASVNGRMVCRVGRQLIAILRHKVAPLELMLEDKLLYDYYAKGLKWARSYSQAQSITRLLAHKNPRANILEIGAGTGGCTEAMLEVLGGGNTTSTIRFSHYDFTDISSGFFEAARKKFNAWGDLVSYKRLDIEKDLSDQGFENNCYDLIIACQVLHATKSMAHTMANVRKLLKPGGSLLLIETTRDELELQFIFGLLPGWWLSDEQERKLSPSLGVRSWDSVLRRAGFTGLEIEVHDCEDEDFYSFSVMLSSIPFESPVFGSQIVIVHGNRAPPIPWLNSLRKSIASITGCAPDIDSMDKVIAEGRICIFVGEMCESILESPTPAQFKALKRLVSGAKGLLWITRGGTIDCARPQSSLSNGFLRALRCEDNSKRYISLDLDPLQELWSLGAARTIFNVFQVAFDETRDQSLVDFEYSEKDGLVCISRIFEDIPENNAISKTSVRPDTEMQPFYQAGREICLGIETPGLLDTLTFSDDPAAMLPLPEEWIEIEPRAFGLNFRDIMVAMGQLNVTTMGFECGGVITRVGAKAFLQGFKVGERVCALMRGKFASFVRLHWTSVCHIPDSMSFEIAASIPMAFTTAYYSLYETARLQRGESVLIHSAAGGVGQAAIMLAQHIGAEVFVTVGSEEKRNYIMQKFDVPSDHIFSSRDALFAQDIMSMTNGKGVDVLLNSLAGKLLQESFNCIAAFGRFVEIGKRDLELNNSLEMRSFTRNVSFSSVDLIEIGIHKGPTIARIMADVIRLLSEKAVYPIKSRLIYPISQLVKAFRTMQGGKHIGKIIISLNQDDQVKLLPQSDSVQLSPKSTYLVVGGLGGIGRSICELMVGRGAKNLIILSRSAETQSSAGAFLERLRQSGCTVTVRSCDIACKQELAKVLSECSVFMPPVRGIIHGAMVLQDSIFERMTFENYMAAIRPKVQGTWNLHELFSDTELDFFIMLSSMAGVAGSTSQANYSAGGTFQDAIARYRTSRGLPAVTIDLGMVRSVGYVAETEGVADRLARLGFRPLDEAEVLSLIESAIMTPFRDPISSQVITGIRTGMDTNSSSGAFWSKDRRFAGLSHVKTSFADARNGNDNQVDLKSQFRSAATLEEAVDILCTATTKKLSEMFLIAEGDIGRDDPLAKYGVDSLVAVELRNWLASYTKLEVSIFDITQSVSLKALAIRVAAKITDLNSY